MPWGQHTYVPFDKAQNEIYTLQQKVNTEVKTSDYLHNEYTSYKKAAESQILTLHEHMKWKDIEIVRLREENEGLKKELEKEKRKNDQQKTNTRNRFDKTKQLAARTTGGLQKDLANTKEELLKYKKDIVPSLYKKINLLQGQDSRR